MVQLDSSISSHILASSSSSSHFYQGATDRTLTRLAKMFGKLLGVLKRQEWQTRVQNQLCPVMCGIEVAGGVEQKFLILCELVKVGALSQLSVQVTHS